jgi:hypothetical protein
VALGALFIKVWVMMLKTMKAAMPASPADQTVPSALAFSLLSIVRPSVLSR